MCLEFAVLVVKLAVHESEFADLGVKSALSGIGCKSKLIEVTLLPVIDSTQPIFPSANEHLIRRHQRGIG